MYNLFIHYTDGLPSYVKLLFIDFGIQCIGFVLTSVLRTEKFYDLFGSVTFLILAFLNYKWHGLASPAKGIQTSCIYIWAFRLGLFLFTRILKTGKDRRFDKIKESNLHLFIVWSLQGVWVIVTSIAKSYSSTIYQTKRNWMAGIHWMGFDKFITTGLWSLSRHPNYFGEILLWFGLYVSASSVFRSYEYLTVFSPVFVYLLITQLSGIPPLEKYGQKKWGKQPSYREYINRTPLLIPFLCIKC
ncbi:hypothetical protein Anas_10814 [Armadillidium nasatum]|uniref:Uncharacterized protein n=1 Tax=Armadillidium nasatum TaxID=96803 RepID=A0A5N5T128_9CRUS|nr:hypothetical protein Anas_10814 [Armadillidium nasatum]